GGGDVAAKGPRAERVGEVAIRQVAIAVGEPIDEDIVGVINVDLVSPTKSRIGEADHFDVGTKPPGVLEELSVPVRKNDTLARLNLTKGAQVETEAWVSATVVVLPTGHVDRVVADVRQLDEFPRLERWIVFPSHLRSLIHPLGNDNRPFRGIAQQHRDHGRQASESS